MIRTKQKEREAKMNQERFQRLASSTRRSVEILDIADVTGLLEKAKPEWRLIVGEMLGGAGPIYSCSIEIQEWNISLEIAIGKFTEYFTGPGSAGYKPYKWVLVVTEGDELKTFLEETIPGMQHSIRGLFEQVDNAVKWKAFKDMAPSDERVKAAVRLFLEGEIS
jgi:hypothetical protein